MSDELMEIMAKQRIPVRRAEMAMLLDKDEVNEGYWDGRDGEPEPGDNRSYSYWHGWRNGAVDGGHRQKDDAQVALVRDWLKSERKIP